MRAREYPKRADYFAVLCPYVGGRGVLSRHHGHARRAYRSVASVSFASASEKDRAYTQARWILWAPSRIGGAQSSVHISVGRANDEEQIDEAAQRIADAAEQLRAFAL